VQFKKGTSEEIWWEILWGIFLGAPIIASALACPRGCLSTGLCRSVVVGLGSFFVAGFPELVASLLEELSCPATVDVPGRE
jgi:hypothetical protein